ncbi:MAG: hypothetical protein C4521_11230 [Actinobacteria bacterium]|nr:MAG: hypothetical protein C4521_11230 [Actinomycetota bacterium]
MLKKNRGALIALITLLVLLLAIVASEIAAYTPSFCARCHRLDYAYWKTSTHARSTCSDCHAARGGLSWVSGPIDRTSMVLAALFGAYDPPITSFVENQNCLSCHGGIKDAIVTRFGIRMRHADVIVAGLRCTDCHNTVAHGKATAHPRSAFMDTCTPCHDGKKAPSKCETCHTSAIDRSPTARLAPWAITHGVNWTKTHGMGNLGTCVTCHPSDACDRCHGMSLPHESNWPRLHGKAALDNGKKVRATDKARSCVGCHSRAYCDGCHQIKMPHPAGFLPMHKKEHERVGAGVCLNCHIKNECDECHVRHVHPGKLRDPYLTPEAKRWLKDE